MGCKDSKENKQALQYEEQCKMQENEDKSQKKIQENEQKVQIVKKIPDNNSKEISQKEEAKAEGLDKAIVSKNKQAEKINKSQIKQDIEQGQKKQLIDKRQKQLKKTQCMICLDQLSNVQTRCNHLFCKECIQGAVKKYNYCPYCRAFDPLANNKEKQPQTAPSQDEWNIKIARKVLYRDEGKEGKEGMRRIYLKNLDNGNEEKTNIYVGNTAKIHCSPTANIFINGQRVNPNECNQQ